MNTERFSAIGHNGIAFWNPISPVVIDRWIQQLPLSATSEVLDVGCGRAELLLRIVEEFDCHAVGVDRAESSIFEARKSAAHRLNSGRLDLRCEAFDSDAFSLDLLDLAICIGSTHAIENLERALRVLKRLVKPEGMILVGEGYWKRDPDPEYLAFLGGSRDDLHTHEGTLALAQELPLEVIKTYESSNQEWSQYEDTYADNIMRFVESNPQDPDAPAMQARIRAWREAYLKWGQDTLGFALYLLRTLS